jgi:hypothetical protein
MLDNLAAVLAQLLGRSRKLSTTRRDFLTSANDSRRCCGDPECRAADEAHDHEHQVVPSDATLRFKALESLLVEKGLVDPAACANCDYSFLGVRLLNPLRSARRKGSGDR